MQEQLKKTTSRIPSLDGLRALAIFLVIEGHLSDRFFQSAKWIPGFGATGVQLFFVISGFIITHNLLKERSQTNQITLRSFWIRRFFRIYPTFFVFMISIFAVSKIFDQYLDLFAYIVTLFLLSAIIPVSGGWYIGHAWSLSVEQVFYLIWPPLLKFGFGINFLLTSIAIWPFLRLSYYLLCEKNNIFYFPIRDLVYNYIFMASGCLLAFLINKYQFNTLHQKKWYFCFCILFIYPFFERFIFENYLLNFKPAQSYISGLSNLVVAFCFSFTILYLIKINNTIYFKFFNHFVISYIGSISYSLYLVQQFFTVPERWAYCDLQKSPINITLMIFFTIALYYSVEKPSILFGQKLFARQKQNK